MDNNKQYVIEPRIIEQADRCKLCHLCLNDPEHQLCKIDFVAGDGAILLMFNDQCTECGYKVSFGSGAVCGCPIRREIMIKYRV
ncbi:MAG: hypothetical protein G8D61_19875 [gamma proteobacterium symbiont of Ctena orbiculata]|nr:hypothetical protein [Candidatus Thiodiazotropha taylori]MBT3063807.1 hypothetical protein [Candidatus Thiodiazotropha sp. (ex Lucina pensylvanica)]PUB72758.1 MAG: hypothetical protein DBP03_15875 [gamma proteobacterium symbiont of Ctena orbiculata]PUB78092.1 MAG: hypothetical protein DBO99_08325 [gamma proteobacterium symbiont of Ctena orbiculata]